MEVHAELARRAEREGKSLQRFLSEKLEMIATTPSLDDVLDRIGGRATGRLSTIDSVEALAAERARH